MELVQHLCVLDERRAQRWRLCVCGQPVCAGAGQLAGVDRVARRYLYRSVDRQSGGPTQPASGSALSGDLSIGFRRVRGEYSGGYSRVDCRGLVRHSDVPGVQCADYRGVALLPFDGCLRRTALRRFVLPRLVRIPQPLVCSGAGVLGRDGVDPSLHRLGRAGGVRGHVHAGGVDCLAGRLEQHQFHPRGKIPVRLGSLRTSDRGHGLGGVVLLRSDPEFR
ncbi:hypothetical protein D3C87_1336670 [compost metagenome]